MCVLGDEITAFPGGRWGADVFERSRSLLHVGAGMSSGQPPGERGSGMLTGLQGNTFKTGSLRNCGDPFLTLLLFINVYGV